MQKNSAVLLAPALTLLLLLPMTAAAQEDRLEDDQSTSTGTVSLASPTTLVVRGETGRYQVFVYGRGADRPASIPAGSRVRIVSRPGAERGVRVASRVTVTGEATAGGTTDNDVVPESIRDLERTVRRQVRRYNVGVRAGLALDPELIVAGVHAQFATGFNSNVSFRPNVEFAFGELTTMFSLNLEGIYRFDRQGRWTPYAGIGPGFNFIHQGLTRKDRNVAFNDFDYDTCLNILGGVEYRNGMWLELKTSVYAQPAPSLRLIVGYNF
jgi:opacity protein-like surface antigen